MNGEADLNGALGRTPLLSVQATNNLDINIQYGVTKFRD
jgi:hypothetical protein